MSEVKSTESTSSIMAREVEERLDLQADRPINVILEDQLRELDEEFNEDFEEYSTEEYVSDVADDLRGRYVAGYAERSGDEPIDEQIDDNSVDIDDELDAVGNDLGDDLGDDLDDGSDDNFNDSTEVDLCLSQGIGCDTFDDECNYSDYDGMCRQVTIYRFHNNGRHCYSAHSNEGVDHGWNFEGALMRLFVNHREGRRPVYRCISNDDGACYLSNDMECDGAVIDSLLGYTSRIQIDRSMPLLQCSNPYGAEQLSTMVESECTSQDWDIEGSLGYVIMPE